MNERLIKLMEHLEFTPSVFADEIGVIRSSISHIMSGRNKPGVDLLQRVLKRFPEVSADWLLAGIGPMFKDGQHTIVNQNPARKAAHRAPVAPKSAEQTNLLGYLESIRQPDEGRSGEQSKPVEQAALPVNGSIEQVDSKPAEPEIRTHEEKAPEPEPAIIMQTAKAAKKERAISKIVVYYNDKTYQEFIPGQD